MSAATISVDEFLALEQKVMQTVELIKKEREARAAAEADAATLRAELAATQAQLAAAEEKLARADEKLAAAGAAQNEIESLHREREAVKLRVESMLAKMDELL